MRIWCNVADEDLSAHCTSRPPLLPHLAITCQEISCKRESLAKQPWATSMYAATRSIAIVLIALCLHLTCAAESSLPDCAVSLHVASTRIERHSSITSQVVCYDQALVAEASCTFADNDCTCGDSPAAAAVQSCILQSCTVKEWLSEASLKSLITTGLVFSKY